MLLRGDLELIGSMVYTKTYTGIFRYFYYQYLVLFTMVPRNTFFFATQAILLY